MKAKNLLILNITKKWIMKKYLKLIILILGVGTISSIEICCNNQIHSNKIKIGYLPMVSSLTHFVALEKGYYKEEGFGEDDIEANPIKTSNLIAQDLVAGHIDAGIELSIVPLLKQLETTPNSAKIFSISSITSANGFDGILVKSNSILTKLEDLSGKKVGVFPGTTAKKSIAEIFKSNYPDLEIPIFVELDPPLHIQTLENGEIDALFTYEPTLSLGIVNYGFKKISTSVYAIQYSPNPIGVAAINARWLEENPKIAKAFFNAIDKSVEFILKNPIEARQILAKATKLNKNVADTMNIMPLSLSTQIDFNNLKGYLEKLKSMDEIKKVPLPQDICIKQ
ncbi:MAG: ABC transporter substrate-binding protein [Bacteroidota bacterium]|nr:ABC transporter substrate-binding protein [Bacteroidota bacterium]